MTTDAGGAGSRDPVVALLEAARRARCRDAEVYRKTVQVRQVAVEPPALEGGPALRVVSRHAEGGTALRVIDAEGREGFAWRGGEAKDAASGDAPDLAAEHLLREALESARLGGRAGVPWPAAPAAAPPPVDGLADPEALRRPDDRLAALATAAVAEVTARGEGALTLDRVVVTEAEMRARLERLTGAGLTFDRTSAAISVAVAPAMLEADAAVEERSACRLDDLDPVAAARAAVGRALPRRPASLPPEMGVTPAPAHGVPGRPPVAVAATIVLAPRAAASLLAALAPLLESGSISTPRPSALSVEADDGVPRRPSSAPFDGAGLPAAARALLAAGRPVGRVDAVSGPFVRPSYRDLPSPGLAALVVAGGRRQGAEDRPGRRAPTDFALWVEALEVGAGSTAWSIEIRRGDWRRLKDAPGTSGAETSGDETSGAMTFALEDAADSLGAADGLTWEGPPAAIVQAVIATLEDTTWFEVGLPVATPSIVLDGLGPWRLPEPAELPAD